MLRAHPVLACVTFLYLVAIVVAAFAIPTRQPGWVEFTSFLIAGALLALLSRASRWWVALGFVWLGAAWVEAGQAVWLSERGSLEDVILGCAGGGIGVGIVAAARALSTRRPQEGDGANAPARRDVSPRSGAAPRDR